MYCTKCGAQLDEYEKCPNCEIAEMIFTAEPFESTSSDGNNVISNLPRKRLKSCAWFAPVGCMFKFVSESILGFAVPLLQNSGIISMDLASSYNSISLLLFVAALFILFLVAFAKTERKIKMICIPAFVIPLAVSSVVNGLSNMLFKEIYYASIVSPSPETLIASSAVSVVSAIIIIGISFALTYVYLSKAEEYFIPATEIDINNTSAQPQRTPVPVSPGIQGAPQMTCNGNYSQSPPKSKIVAALLCFFLGAFGIHRFYVGKVGTGILWLFTGGLFFIGDFVDFFVIIFGGFKDSEGKKLE